MILGAVSRKQLRAQRDVARAERDEVKRQLAAVKHREAKTAGDLRELRVRHRIVQRIAWDRLDERLKMALQARKYGDASGPV